MASIEKRTNDKQEIAYRVKVRLKGFPTETATFERLTDARRWAQQTETAMREGRYFKTSEAKKHTLGVAIDRYIKTVLPQKPRSQYPQTLQLKYWKEVIGHFLLSDITPALIAEQREKLAGGTTARHKLRTPATVNRYLAAISHLFTVAVKEWGWVEANPLQKVTKLREPRGRVRFLSDEERHRLLEACEKSESPWLYLIVMLALSTGARRMEILGLRWEDVDLNRGIITLHETKNGERRILPLTGHALTLLKEHIKIRPLNANLIFPGKNLKNPIDIRSPWETALKRAEIKDYKFHDNRHSAASWLAMSGASMAEIAEVLGHKTLQMVKRYSHLSEAHTAGVVARMNEKIFGV